MSNDLTVKKEDLLAVIDEKGIGDVIRPLVSEIHLFDTYISGTSRLKDPSAIEHLQTGEKLTLKREETIFDDNAISIYNAQGQKLGYVPEKDNIVFSRLMDAGKLLIAKVGSSTQMHGFLKVNISIYLVDY